MNLNDLLKNYKAKPIDEIRKINIVLNRKGYVSSNYVELKDFFRDVFLLSEYSSYESTFDSFCDYIVFDEGHYYGLSNNEITISQYCIYCELLLNLMRIKTDIAYYYHDTFADDISQLNKLIKNGLELCGYKTVERNKTIETQKINLVAETIAAIDKTYQDDIYDYLIAKTLKDKENALTNLSIKLDAMEPTNNYVKQNKKYVQLLRHKEDKDIQKEYSWFFEETSYIINLEKLFRIYLFMISYNDCSNYLKEFEQKRVDK